MMTDKHDHAGIQQGLRVLLWLTATGIILAAGWIGVDNLIPGAGWSASHIVILQSTRKKGGLKMKVLNDGAVSAPVYGGWVVACPHRPIRFARWPDTPRWIPRGHVVTWTEPWPAPSGERCALAMTVRLGSRDAVWSVVPTGMPLPIPQYETLDPRYRARHPPQPRKSTGAGQHRMENGGAGATG